METSASIGARIREEREALGLTQTAFAQLASATRQTQSNYEKGERNPDSVYLAAIAAAGADVQYILTGVRMMVGHLPGPAPPLTPREAALLDNYRHSSDAARDALDRTCAAFAQPDLKQAADP